MAKYLTLGTLGILISCSYSEPQWEIYFGAFLPDTKILQLSVNDLPAPLSMGHHFPQAVDEQAARKFAAQGKANPFSTYFEGKDGVIRPMVSMNHDRFLPSSEYSTEQLADLFDPFYLGGTGGPNGDINVGDSNCAALRDGEPDDLMRFGDSWCLIGVVKFALHKAVTHYDNFHRVLVTIIENLKEGQNAKGGEEVYINPSVVTLKSVGLRISVFFDDCLNHTDSLTADPDAYNMCLGKSLDSVYHRVRIYPLNPKDATVTVDSVIGKMEWLQNPLSTTVDAKMAINKALMSDDTFSNFAPAQMQFELSSDAEGKFKSFVIKHANRYLCCNVPNFEDMWEADVIKVTHIPGNPGMWTVQGSVLYELAVAINPLRGNTVDPNHNVNKRVYFAAVSEDVFSEGRSIYKVIMADKGGLGPFDYENIAPDRWDNELHLWAGYKKLLRQQFTEAHYVGTHGFDGTPVRLWDISTGAEIVVSDSKDAGINITSVDLSGDESRLVVAGETDIQIYSVINDGYGGRWLKFEGSCQPFPAATTKLSNAVFNPMDSTQVLVGDNTSGNSSTGNREARIVDVSNIVTGNCPTLTTYTHLPSTSYARSLEFVDFSLDGTRIMTRNVWFDFLWVWDVANTIEPILMTSPTNYVIYSIHFDHTGNRIITTAANNASYVTDIATGSTLRLYNDEGSNAAFQYRQYAAFDNPLFPNQIITTRKGGGNDDNPAYIYRWDISSWNPDPLTGGGDATWTTSTSPNLIQQVEQRNSAGQHVYIESGAINPAGDQIVLNSNDGSYFYSLNTSTGEIGTLQFSKKHNHPKSPVYFVDGNTLLQANGSDILFWDISAGATPAPFEQGHIGSAISAVFSADQSAILSAGVDGDAILWSAENGRLLKRFAGNGSSLAAAIFTHGGARVLTAGSDAAGINGIANLWDADLASPTYGTVLQAFTDHTGPVVDVDYDNNFGLHRIATASADGSVKIYDDAGLLLADFPDLFVISSITRQVYSIDFSHDGRYLAATGLGGDNHVVIIDTDPTTTYGAYNLLGHLNLHPTHTWVNTIQFFPGDSSRILTAGRPTDNSARVNVLSYTPDVTDPINNPPTVSAVEEKLLVATSTSAVVTDQLHGLIVGRLSTGSGCSGCPRITHWDLNPASPTYGLQFNTTDPIGPAIFYDTQASQTQNRAIIYSASGSPDGTMVVGASQGSPYNASWIDFDTYFNEVDPVTFYPLRPDEGENVNPYYVEPVATSAGCYVWDFDTLSCSVTCEDVTGCNGYNVTSQFTYDTTTATVPSTFDALVTELSKLEGNPLLPDGITPNPDYKAGYYLDQYVSTPLN